MAWGKRSGGDGCMGRLALVLAVLALILAWMAYRRTGGDLETLLRAPWEAGRATIEGRSGDGSEAPAAESGEAGWRARLAEARAKLLENRGEVEAERNLDQVRKDIENIRRDLRTSFDGASEVTQATLERWRQVDAELERLQTQVRDGSNQAVDTLDSVADRLRSWGQDGER